MKGEAIIFGVLTTLAVAGSARGAKNRRGSRSHRYMYIVTEEIQETWEEDADSPDSSYDADPPAEIDLATGDELYEVLGLDVDALPGSVRDRLPAWICAAVSFFKMIEQDGFTVPEYGIDAPNYYEWPDWETLDYRTGQTHKKSIFFGERDVRSLLSGSEVNIASHWPDDAKRLILALLTIKRNTRRLYMGRTHGFPQADMKAIESTLAEWRGKVNQILVSALGVDHLELDLPGGR